MSLLDSLHATVSTNARGNLVVHVPRWRRAVFSTMVALAYSWLELGLLEGDELFLSLMPYIIGIAIVWAIAYYLFARLDPDLEFDRAKQNVMRGSRVVASYKNIRCVELMTNVMRDDGQLEVNLCIGTQRRHRVLITNDETEASLIAADCARAVGKEVVVADSALGQRA